MNRVTPIGSTVLEGQIRHHKFGKIGVIRPLQRAQQVATAIPIQIHLDQPVVGSRLKATQVPVAAHGEFGQRGSGDAVGIQACGEIGFAAKALPLMAEMEANCRELVAGLKSRGNHQYDFPDNLNVGQCWGAFEVFQSLQRMQFKGTDATVLDICVPEKLRRLQYVKIFLKYAENHPENGHKDFGIEAWRAIHDTFPCKK